MALNVQPTALYPSLKLFSRCGHTFPLPPIAAMVIIAATYALPSPPFIGVVIERIAQNAQAMMMWGLMLNLLCAGPAPFS